MKRDLRRAAERQGWEIEASDRHEKWRCPTCRRYIVCSSTPSDPHAVKNHIALLRKHGFTWEGRARKHC